MVDCVFLDSFTPINEVYLASACLTLLMLMYRPWLNVLHSFWQELNSLEPHENFRLWLTAESHPKFPTILLQSSLKVTYEVSKCKNIYRKVQELSIWGWNLVRVIPNPLFCWHSERLLPFAVRLKIRLLCHKPEYQKKKTTERFYVWQSSTPKCVNSPL